MNSMNFFIREPSCNLTDLVPRVCSYHEAKYRSALDHIPTPGYGHGCHRYFLGVATLGIKAGHSSDEIFSDIKAATPAGKREVTAQEILDAIARALLDTAPAGSGHSVSIVEIPHRKKLSEMEAARVREHVLSYSKGPVKLDCDEFKGAHGFQVKSQPIMSLHPEAFTMIQFLQELFDQDDLLWIGSENSVGPDSIRPAGEWVTFFEEKQRAFLERLGNEGWDSSTPSAFLINLGRRFSHVVPNPVTGRFGKTKAGKLSLRCDDCIRDFRYAVIDFDGYETLEEQGEVLHCLCEALGINLSALIHTGGRGCHAWVKLEGVDSLDAWNKIVRDGLFPTFEALGADPACFNPSRASRLPGIYRPTTASWQKLIIATKKGFKV